MKTLTSARPKLPIFWNWVSKNITDQQKCAGFQKSRKSAKSLHPTVHVREFYCISKSSIFYPNKIYFCPLKSSDTPKTRLGLRQKIIPKCYRQDLCATLRRKKVCEWEDFCWSIYLPCGRFHLAENVPDYSAKSVPKHDRRFSMVFCICNYLQELEWFQTTEGLSQTVNQTGEKLQFWRWL